ncbi:MAG: bifunctional chorismate mutase/prephenate dehydratase [Lachnospiraceae bacterium]
MADDEKLSEIRSEIDRTDDKIAALLQERLTLCERAAARKEELGLPVRDEEVEQRKLARMEAQAPDGFRRQSTDDIFRQLMAVSRKDQYRRRRGISQDPGVRSFTRVPKLPTEGKTVVFQGVEGAYSQAAMYQYFGRDVKNFHVPSFAKAMEAVSAGEADYAVLPIENSSAGQVGDVYDLLVRYSNAIVGEVYLPVRHCLLGLPGSSVETVKRVYSHPQGLMQCGMFLNSHPDWQQISQPNTAMAAKKVVEDGSPEEAAIASELAGELYGLTVLKEAVNDNPLNTTRFIIVSRQRQYTDAASKVSICFEIVHQVGSLYNTLSHIIYNNLNMNKIESRPIPDRPFEYRFFVDFEGNLSLPGVENALSGMRSEVRMLRILGNY